MLPPVRAALVCPLQNWSLTSWLTTEMSPFQPVDVVKHKVTMEALSLGAGVARFQAETIIDSQNWYPSFWGLNFLSFSSLPGFYLSVESWGQACLPSRVSVSLTCTTKNSFGVIQRLPGEGQAYEHGFSPSSLPLWVCHISLKRTWSHNRASPKCTPEHDEYSIQLNFTCSNDSRPTRLPYVQETSIARCMSKFSFSKCNFLQNLLAPHNAASWLQKRLFCHLGLK